MRKSVTSIAAALPTALLASLAIHPAAGAAQQVGEIRNADSAEAVRGSYIVVLEQGRAAQVAEDLAGRYGGAVRDTYTSFPAFSAKMDESQAKRLAADPAVAYVEQDRIVSADTIQDDPPSWGLDRIDERDRPTDDQYGYDVDGAGVNVYVIDSGILTNHVDFEGRAHHGRNTADDNNDTTDCNGHGTHVAGTIGGRDHGVAKKATLFGVMVFGNCSRSGSVSDVIQGIDWVTNHFLASGEPSAVANMSMGGDTSDSLDAAVNASMSAGITYVVAAGNENTNACSKSPARVPNAITVGATTVLDMRASYSNHGSCVDLFAPGSQITSAALGVSLREVAVASGTSMAAPHVAGVAALYLSKNPDGGPSRVAAAIVGDATRDRITGVGANSPNRLLYRVIGPVVKHVDCESALNSVTCETATGGGISPTVTWKRDGRDMPAWNGRLLVTDSCATGSVVTMTVTATDVDGRADVMSNSTTCRSGPRP